MAVDLIDSTTGSTASFVYSYALTVLFWMSSLRSGKNVRTKARKICTCKLNRPWMTHQVVMTGKRQSHTPNDTDPFTNFLAVYFDGSNAEATLLGTKVAKISTTL